MARLVRADVFDPTEVAVVHCINRCVRRCFLCGDDPLTGRNYDHRKAWLEARLEFLAGHFGIDILGYSILSNHFHVVVRNRPDVVATWSDTEVARRWLQLCPRRRTRTGEPAEPTDAELGAICNVPDRLAVVRRRLADISWLMRMVAEPVARHANREDQVTGRFWQGRFKAVRLCDEAAILACAVYVDLNPVRAGLARTPEASPYTSVRRRIRSRTRSSEDAATRPDGWLAPLELREATAAPGPQACTSGRRASDKGFLPLSQDDYFRIVDWTGRQVVRGRCGAIPPEIAPALERVGIATGNWLPLATHFGQLFHRVAGAPHTLARLHSRRPLRPGRAMLLAAR